MSLHTSSLASKLAFASITFCAALTIGTHRVAAVAIPVPNGGFETDTLSNGGIDTTPSDWVVAGTFSAAGAFNPADSQFTGTTSGSPPSPAEGTNIALINVNRSGTAGSQFATFTSAASLGIVESGTYTLTVAVGRRKTTYVGDEYKIEMLLDDVVFAPSTFIFDATTVPADSFVDIMTSFTATSSEIGSALKLRVTQSSFAGSGTAAGHFDNVRLNFDPPPVPEPSSFLLLGLGALGLLRHTRRRRRKACTLHG